MAIVEPPPVVAAPADRAPEVDVSPEEQAALLDLARVAVAAAARGEIEVARRAALRAAHPTPDDEPRRGAAFVTLLERGDLRGCIGLLDASRPLAESVAEAAIAAVQHDWRFRPVTDEELPDIEIEVSVLGRFVVLDDPTSFRLGVDGLLVERGYDRGLLLPEVATEHRFGTRAMLQAVCGKAGLPADAWRDRRTRVSAFRTRRFGGPALGSRGLGSRGLGSGG
jgi:AmmeMemoRadiSam system protein A